MPASPPPPSYVNDESASVDDVFPDPAFALDDPNGLLASGGNLAPGTLLEAYSKGIFPWFNSDDEPVLWWSPDPRAIIEPAQLHVSRRLARRLRSGQFSCTFDEDFDAVVAACAEPRDDSGGTWITPAMARAYGDLHRMGWAHCVAVHEDSQLVGGLYGVAIGTMFFAESMFSRTTDASKVAMAALCETLSDWHFSALDCQMMTEHLGSMGAQEIAREPFLARVAQAVNHPSKVGNWGDAAQIKAVAYLEVRASLPYS